MAAGLGNVALAHHPVQKQKRELTAPGARALSAL